MHDVEQHREQRIEDSHESGASPEELSMVFRLLCDEMTEASLG